MIKQITKLKDFGIFSDFKCTSASLREFKRFNLIYGWNGSGKSTLTKLFSCLEKKCIHSDYSTTDFNISVDAHPVITPGNIADNILNIRVFNQDFVSDNIEWDNDKTAKSILILSEEKIEDKKRLDQIKKDLIVKNTLHKSKEITLIGEEKVRDTFLSGTAKTIKEAFKIIDTSDTHYFNYSKTKLDAFIAANHDKLIQPSAILATSQLSSLTTSIQPNSKPLLNFELAEIENEKLLDAETRIEDIVKTNLLSNAIKRLKENPDIQDWVRQGIELHEKHSSESCEYCGQSIPQERIDGLGEHFNDSYVKFIQRLTNAIEWLTHNKLTSHELPDASSFYDELQKNYLIEKDSYALSITKINSVIEEWYQKLEGKKINPFVDHPWLSDSVVGEVEKLNLIIGNINALKESHNLKTANFDAELKILKTKLETHYAASSIKERQYIKLLTSIDTLKNDLETSNNVINDLKKEMHEIEKQLTDEVKGASQFNDLLHSFLGRDDISLQFIESERGYKILRRGSTQRAKNLSEGEKTAIAFIYFIIKLQENGNKISDTIVIVDDPVSSLDSNHLIHAYSFLKNQCKDVKQLFVLTHNFHFFKLVRDWIFYVKTADGDKNYFTIDSGSKDGVRFSQIGDANNFLLKYNSEYHFLFHKLVEYSNKEQIELEDMYTISNVARRFIESLLTFKYPKKTKDIWEKFEKVNFDGTKKTKVYKFINLYSHNDKIESHETFGDNIFAEGKPVITNTLEFIKAIDEEHYNELLSIYHN